MSGDDEVLDAADTFAETLAAAQQEMSRAEFFGLLSDCTRHIEAETGIEYRRACQDATEDERFALLD